MKKMLEICCDSLQSVRNADRAGADRIELCSDLSSGGLTPTVGMVVEALKITHLPINVLIRPRAGNFVYSSAEVNAMCTDIDMLQQLGVNGFVSGALLPNGSIDTATLRLLLRHAAAKMFTFHRAIDFCNDLFAGFATLVDMGISTVLTSGGHACVDAGLDELLLLQQQFGNQIDIMPGGGLNVGNAKILVKHGFRQFHFSGSTFEDDPNKYTHHPDGLGFVVDKNGLFGANVANCNKIREMITTLNQ